MTNKTRSTWRHLVGTGPSMIDCATTMSVIRHRRFACIDNLSIDMRVPSLLTCLALAARLVVGDNADGQVEKHRYEVSFRRHSPRIPAWTAHLNLIF